METYLYTNNAQGWGTGEGDDAWDCWGWIVQLFTNNPRNWSYINSLWRKESLFFS